jgi:hypothetical protein
MEKERGIIQLQICCFRGSFLVGTLCIVCVNMAGNVDINMPGIEMLWCYSCGGVCFKYCVLMHD